LFPTITKNIIEGNASHLTDF